MSRHSEPLSELDESVLHPPKHESGWNDSMEAFLGLDPSRVEYLDSGEDSIVLRLPQEHVVAKVYGSINGRTPHADRPIPKLSEQTVQEYQELIEYFRNKLGFLSTQENGLLEGNVRLEFNPILEVGVSPKLEAAVAISPEVDGMNLRDILRLSDEEIAAWLGPNYNKANYGRLYDMVHQVLFTSAQRDFQHPSLDFGTWPDIGLENIMVKPRASVHDPVDLVITDLFVRVGNTMKNTWQRK